MDQRILNEDEAIGKALTKTISMGTDISNDFIANGVPGKWALLAIGTAAALTLIRSVAERYGSEWRETTWQQRKEILDSYISNVEHQSDSCWKRALDLTTGEKP